MVNQRSKELIIEYIAELDGKATKNKVAKHMRNEVDEKYTLAKETVKRVIRDFEQNGRITIQRGKRPGQPHYLRVVGESWYDRISANLSGTEKFLQEPNLSKKILKARQDLMIESLLLQLWNANRKITYESDRQVLNQRIIDLLIDIKFERFNKYIPRPT